MNIITVDMETYYSREFSLSKITTEEYIRSPMFEVIGVGVKVDNNPTEWASGSMEQTAAYLRSFDWENSALLAHNTMFDGAILSWKFGIRPKVYLDTLCMARALHGTEVGGSLKALVERYGLGAKGTEVLNALGKRRRDFTEEELSRYGDYCVNDVELTYALFRKMLAAGFPKKELKLIDLTLRMFTDPALELDQPHLEQHLMATQAMKDKLLVDAGVADKADLMSNPKFALMLNMLGVTPPMKISPTTGKETFAFAKSDEDFKALAEHEDSRVQALVAARLGNKSTLEETRTQRFIDIAGRGKLPVPIRYYAAHTGRWGGDDKINLQNLPSRGPNAKQIKKAIIAPEGYTIIEADSSQIEARVLAWLAGQDDIVQAFAEKKDVYKKMASAIYGKPEDQIDKQERHVGKTTVLGCGYGMGAEKFQDALKNSFPPTELPLDETRRVINVYRDTNWKIVQLWRNAQNALINMSRGDHAPIDVHGLLETVPDVPGIRLPSGLVIRYDDLRYDETDKGLQFHYQTRQGRTRIYGGKVVENFTQGVARCIIGEQMLNIAKTYRVVLTVHDSIVCLVRDEEVPEAQAFIEAEMRRPPEWAPGLPVDCESGVGKSYGECE